jgi:hypothetical protein
LIGRMTLEGAAPGGDQHGDLHGSMIRGRQGGRWSVWEGGWAAKKRFEVWLYTMKENKIVEMID